jgi:hypothetical protein
MILFNCGSVFCLGIFFFANKKSCRKNLSILNQATLEKKATGTCTKIHIESSSMGVKSIFMVRLWYGYNAAQCVDSFSNGRRHMSAA